MEQIPASNGPIVVLLAIFCYEIAPVLAQSRAAPLCTDF